MSFTTIAQVVEVLLQLHNNSLLLPGKTSNQFQSHIRFCAEVSKHGLQINGVQQNLMSVAHTHTVQTTLRHSVTEPCL